MKCTTLRAAACALFLITIPQITNATILVQGNTDGTSTQNTATFKTSVLAKLFDHPTGTFIASTALISDAPGGANDFAIATATGTFGADIPLFNPIAPSFAQEVNVTMLALATSRANTNPNIAFVTTTGAPGNEPTVVNMVSLDGDTSFQGTTILNDASNVATINANGDPTTQITNIAANGSFVFAAVNPTTSGSTFGQTGSGIAVESITPTTLTLTQVPAIPGDGGIKAFPFDDTTPQIVIDGAVNINPNLLPNSTQLTYPAMVWDDILQRLYIGYDLETTNSAGYSASGGRSVTAAYINNPSGTLSLLAMAPASAFMANNYTNIVGVVFDEYCPSSYCYPAEYYPEGCDPTDQVEPYCEGQYPPVCVCPEVDLSVHKLGVLHASTGPTYLIVNGGNGTRDQTGNLIYALPLVDNPSSPTTHGTLANKNSPLASGKFTVPATNNSDLVTNTDPAALVGAGPFPIQAADQLSDMVVIGDTVYASSAQPLSTVTESGIFYSQAMFDETGKIIRWTPWTKRSFPYTGFPNNSPQVFFFDVDESTGEVWAVGGTSATSVCVTAWGTGDTPASLVAQVNKNLASTACAKTCYSGCYSVLDLDQSTRGFKEHTCSRYALFGGINTVVFTQVSEAFNVYCADPNSPQAVTTDYSLAQNLLATTLPECGPVTVLEYSRRGDAFLSETVDNFFYAGTQNGLFVFASPQASALSVEDFTALNEPPFNTAQWFKAPNINGAVIDIKTTGNMLYVLTVNSTPAAPLAGTIYRIPFQPTINAMFSPANIIPIAQTMTSPAFSTILRFSGIQIISTSPDGSTEQLVLSTNRGLFQSSRVGGVQAAANQTDANWQLVPNSGSNFYLGIGSMHTSIPIAPPSTVWPFNLQDPLSLKLFNRGSIYQLNGGDSNPFNFVPAFFNSIESSNPNFATLDQITYFWSDGARRFFVVNPFKQTCAINADNTLMVLPFDTIDWNIARPQQDLFFDPALENVQSFNWVQDIGVTGIVMAGTNKGVVGLE